MKSVRAAEVEHALGGRLQCGSLQPSGRPAARSRQAGHPARAYNSCPNWPGAKYSESNFWDVVPRLLATNTYTNLVLLSPTSDLTNLKDVQEGSHVALAQQSARNMFHTMIKALKTNPTLQKVVIFEMFPRTDSPHLSTLASTYNATLRWLVATSFFSQAKRIVVVGHPSLAITSTSKEQAMFGSPSGRGADGKRVDGIHFRGAEGSSFVTKSIVEGLKAAASSCPDDAQPAGWSTQSRRGAASTPALPTSPPVPTANRFLVLNC